MSEELDPRELAVWQPLLDLLAEMEAARAAEAVAEVDAAADLDAWLEPLGQQHRRVEELTLHPRHPDRHDRHSRRSPFPHIDKATG
jgi:hypothetical protein